MFDILMLDVGLRQYDYDDMNYHSGEAVECTIVILCVCVCVIGFFTDVYQSDMIIYVWGPTFNVTIRKT